MCIIALAFFRMQLIVYVLDRNVDHIVGRLRTDVVCGIIRYVMLARLNSRYVVVVVLK